MDDSTCGKIVAKLEGSQQIIIDVAEEFEGPKCACLNAVKSI